ncbi:MAG: guanine deaminase [Cyclonatronaceae bacterium]
MNTTITQIQLFRGRLAFMTGDPDISGKRALSFFPDGILAVKGGFVIEAGSAAELSGRFPADIPVTDFGSKLIIPGLVDAHVHSSQTLIIASYGEKLLEWLQKYAFPEEDRHRDFEYARLSARLFINELLRNGTTTANVFTTVHPHTADLLFEEALSKNMRLIAGKVLMDRNAPDSLLDNPEKSWSDSAGLIRKWHNRARLGYAVMPRFAITSSAAQLGVAARLLRDFEGVWMHTHLSENLPETALVQKLYPDCSGYWNVYEHHGLAGPKSVFAHGVHLDDNEFGRLGASGSSIAVCPSSNLFLGSGLFRFGQAGKHGIKLGIGSDIGAGTSFSVLANLSEAYKIARLGDVSITPEKAFYLATLGGAAALSLDNRIGTFKPGFEADFTVLDPGADPLLQKRTTGAATFSDLFFPVMMMGDNRIIHSTWIMGVPCYKAQTSPAQSAAS